MNNNIDLIIYTDGGARGNPGEAAYGFIVYDRNSKEIYKEGKRLGISTNNIAEYMGVVSALRWISENYTNENPKIQFYLDSELVARQLSGQYKVKNEYLRNLFFTAKVEEDKIKGQINYQTISREKNGEADKLVNLALDGKI